MSPLKLGTFTWSRFFFKSDACIITSRKSWFLVGVLVRSVPVPCVWCGLLRVSLSLCVWVWLCSLCVVFVCGAPVLCCARLVFCPGSVWVSCSPHEDFLVRSRAIRQKVVRFLLKVDYHHLQNVEKNSGLGALALLTRLTF